MHLVCRYTIWVELHEGCTKCRSKFRISWGCADLVIDIMTVWDHNIGGILGGTLCGKNLGISFNNVGLGKG